MAAVLLVAAASPALQSSTLLHSPSTPAVSRLGTPVAIYTMGNAEQRRMQRDGGFYEDKEETGNNYFTRGRHGRHDRYGGRYGVPYTNRGYGQQREVMPYAGNRRSPYGESFGDHQHRSGWSGGSLRQEDVRSPYGVRGRDNQYDRYGPGACGGTGGPHDREHGDFGMQDMHGMGMRRGRREMRGEMRGEMDFRDMPRNFRGPRDMVRDMDFEMEGRMHDMHGRGGRFADYGMQVVDRYGGVGRRGHLELD